MKRTRAISIAKLVGIPLLLLILLATIEIYRLPTDVKPVSLSVSSSATNPNRPVLAFYYPWYTPSTWCLCTMSNLPTIRYNSNDNTTIDRQVQWAAHAGITGFISSWWGQGDKTDTNFDKVLAHAATLA